MASVWRCAIGALLWLAVLQTAQAFAVIREIDIGEVPALGKDQALLLIGVDTSERLEEVRIERDGFALNAGKLRRIEPGRSMQLYAVPVGRYRWDRARIFGWLFRLSDDEEYYFDVKPGVINYPGDLVVRPRGFFSALFHIANRGLLAMDWLDANHPALAKSLPFAYSGHYADPFPAFYRNALAGRARAPDTSTPVPGAGALPIPVEPLWRPSRLRALDLNAAGDLLAELVHENDTWIVELFDLRAGTSTRLIETAFEISEVEWSGDRDLLVSVGGGSMQDVFVLQVRDTPDGTRSYTRLKVPRRGHVVDALPHSPGEILFATETHFGLHVFRLDIRSQRALDAQKFRTEDTLERGIADDVAWFADAQGALRVALVRTDDGLRFLHGRNGEFERGPLLSELHGFAPHALSADGTRLYGITGEQREQDELVALDVATGKVSDTLYRRPGIDIVAPVLDGARRLIGASYFEHGQLVTDYFDAADSDIDRRLRAAFPGRSVWLLDRSAAREQFILNVGGSDLPSRIYHLDVAQGRASLLDESRPWLAPYRFAPAHLVRTRSPDGFDIEAYLTLPPGVQGKAPLVVMPHGGPMGVRDVRAFDPDVQFIASLGYAVLQVNFRGSVGFGRAFRDAAQGGYGTRIEDDIDAALQAALSAYPLDATRMCVLGASYGGYSALVSVMRWPGRFRCAISMFGISDRMLQFTATDAGRSAEGRALLERWMGDPDTQQDAMLAGSPLYHVDRLTLPLMLVHGVEDLRVDFEQTRRLVRLLNLVGRPPVLIRLEDEGHGIVDPARREAVWHGIAGFLRRHLGGAAVPDGAAPDAAARAPAPGA